MSIKEHPPLHVPVLLESTLATMQPQLGESYLDLTAGYGGHARAFLSITDNYTDSYLVDRDEYAHQHLVDLKDRGVHLLHTDFLSAAKELIDQKKQFSLILLDLGVSSPQLDIASRGFSFTNSGPLDMRMDASQSLTAEVIVNSWRQDKLTQIIREYGEESLGTARRYAAAIVAARPLQTTGELAQAILNVHVGKWQKVHPATRTFQAIRIAVNDELRQVEEVMPLLSQLLKSGGRVGIISFHSLEDRIVKRYLVDQDRSGLESEMMMVNRKPIAGDIYDVHNPRSRSAKLRVAVKK